MVGKVWELAVLCIVVCFAVKLLVSTVIPLLPALIVVMVVIGIGGSWYHRKRNW